MTRKRSRVVGGVAALALLAAAPAVQQPSAGTHALKVAIVFEPGGAVVFATHVDGFKRAVREFGLEGRVLTPPAREGYLPTFTMLAAQGYDLVIATSGYQIEALATAARRSPATKFVLIDSALEAVPGRPPNVQAVVLATEEPSFLAGYLAASVERVRQGRDVVSAVGGFEIPPVDAFIAGYEAGAKYAVPGISVLRAYSRSFRDRDKCRQVARDQIAKGSGVVFNVAGVCGLGALEAAREGGVWGIGVDDDQSSLGPFVLTSVLKRFDVAVYRTIRRLVHGTLTTGSTTVLGLRDGAVGLGRISPRVPAALVRGLARVRKQLVAGEIDVPSELT